MDVSNRSEHQLRVDEFMRLAKQELPCRPVTPSLEVRRLRAKMHLEETLETIEGLGFKVSMDPDYSAVTMESIRLDELPEGPDLVKIADGCADSRVISTGTLSACGVDDEPIQRVVDEANLQKFGPGSYRRADGKWMKPPDFTPPDVAGELKRQGWLA